MTEWRDTVPDMRGRPFDDPNWVDPRPEAKEKDLVYCCGTLGWVSPGVASDHAYEVPEFTAFMRSDEPGP
jgi:hypothetical protein